MKKVILMGLALLSSFALADEPIKYVPKVETVTVPYTTPHGPSGRKDMKFYATTMCIGGYLFAVSTHYKENEYHASSGMAMVQIFAPSVTATFPPQPITCKK